MGQCLLQVGLGKWVKGIGWRMSLGPLQRGLSHWTQKRPIFRPSYVGMSSPVPWALGLAEENLVNKVDARHLVIL